MPRLSDPPNWPARLCIVPQLDPFQSVRKVVRRPSEAHLPHIIIATGVCVTEREVVQGVQQEDAEA